MESDFRAQIEATAREYYTGSMAVSPIPDEIPGQGGGAERPFDLLIGYQGVAACCELKFSYAQSIPWTKLKAHQELNLMAQHRTGQRFSGVVIQWRFQVLERTQREFRKAGLERPCGPLVEVWGIPIDTWVKFRQHAVKGSLTFPECCKIGFEIPPIDRVVLPDRWTLCRLFKEAP